MDRVPKERSTQGARCRGMRGKPHLDNKYTSKDTEKRTNCKSFSCAVCQSPYWHTYGVSRIASSCEGRTHTLLVGQHVNIGTSGNACGRICGFDSTNKLGPH